MTNRVKADPAEIAEWIRIAYPGMPEALVMNCADHAATGVIYEKGLDYESVRAAVIATARHSTDYDEVNFAISEGRYESVPEAIRGEVVKLEAASLEALLQGDDSDGYRAERADLVRSFFNRQAREQAKAWEVAESLDMAILDTTATVR